MIRFRFRRARPGCRVGAEEWKGRAERLPECRQAAARAWHVTMVVRMEGLGSDVKMNLK